MQLYSKKQDAAYVQAVPSYNNNFFQIPTENKINYQNTNSPQFSSSVENKINEGNNNSTQLKTSAENKINELTIKIQKIAEENEKIRTSVSNAVNDIKPLLKTIIDMQFYTFQKIKKYQNSLDELGNGMLDTNNLHSDKKPPMKTHGNKNVNPRDEIIDLSHKLPKEFPDDDEFYSFIESTENKGEANKKFLEP
jgi:vacuolar-type H+-ATPase subunit I/STV1